MSLVRNRQTRSNDDPKPTCNPKLISTVAPQCKAHAWDSMQPICTCCRSATRIAAVLITVQMIAAELGCQDSGYCSPEKLAPFVGDLYPSRPLQLRSAAPVVCSSVIRLTHGARCRWWTPQSAATAQLQARGYSHGLRRLQAGQLSSSSRFPASARAQQYSIAQLQSRHV